MAKFTLSLNSHTLSYLQQCEMKYFFNAHMQLTSAQSNNYMARGTAFAKWVEHYYKNQIRSTPFRSKQLFNAPLWLKHWTREPLKLTPESAKEIYMAGIGYMTQYKDETWQPIYVEKGFTHLLYEDEENLFVYEGRPDLVAYVSPTSKQVIVVDHKTQAKQEDIYPFNNQALGYCWALNTDTFCYNYIKFLSKTVEYRRSLHKFTPAQIDSWKSRTIEWYFRAKDSILKKKFLPSGRCVEKYGPCEYTRICEEPKAEVKAFVVRTLYKINEYRSW